MLLARMTRYESECCQLHAFRMAFTSMPNGPGVRDMMCGALLPCIITSSAAMLTRRIGQPSMGPWHDLRTTSRTSWPGPMIPCGRCLSHCTHIAPDSVCATVGHSAGSLSWSSLASRALLCLPSADGLGSISGACCRRLPCSGYHLCWAGLPSLV